MEKERFIGINIGSVSVNVVSLYDKKIEIFKRNHYGKPKDTLNKVLSDNNIQKGYFDISGSFGTEISEIAAIERGITEITEEPFDLIISLGGESFVLYVINYEGQIVNILSHDKCAAGSGEFFIQQIDRLNISLDDAIELTKKGNKIHLASRCSVHCKSDITHKLNKGEAAIEDILTSVIYSMVNKVLALINQSRVNPNRILLIGGVALNEAFVRMLRKELTEAEVVIENVSSVFEAYGTSLLVKDNPELTEPNLKITQSFSSLPTLKDFEDQVTIIHSSPNKSNFNRDQSFLLGVDVGSTTTKAVLVDPSDMGILASHYGRTSGNPVKAARECITKIIDKIGNCKVKLVGVTGSGRQIVGAYFGTPAVFNEISAHSEGAAYFDPEVDTIFEIGGQDSKYAFLQNSVPVDYAMNASCSAGTGSFLEESAKGDLGISVFDISHIAIQALEPIRFQVDCAAFINTDIRTALQEGYTTENIIGGLVYSIVNNYLNKVKANQPVGKKIFFQGGVAKNSSVGYAFAQATGKEIIIPPNPELMGAFGIALFAKKALDRKDIEALDPNKDLEDLIESKLEHGGSFTCKACKNYCTIEQYKVGERKFSFGGRCSRYENIRLGTNNIEKVNLVAKRNQLMLEGFKMYNKQDQNTEEIETKGSIGIPRALLTHSLYPLFETFFEELGYTVILSDIEQEHEFRTNAAFCYPTQILHGAVSDLINHDVDWIFLPHVYNLPKHKEWTGSTFCPITQSSPYVIAQAFTHKQLLDPVLNFIDGYGSDKGLKDMGVKILKQPKKLVEEAFEKAVEVQEQLEANFLKIGKNTLKEINKKDEIGIILVGRSYNAFPPETSQLVPKKLSSMGVTVIPFDFLPKNPVKDIPWYFANYVKLAVELVKDNNNLFLLYINSYSCTIDAFMQNFVRSELKSKPYLLLELDAHTGDAGTQTRLEAFLEIIKNYRKAQKNVKDDSYNIAQVKIRQGKTVVITSENELVDIKDPRVKLYFPPFSPFHNDMGAKIFELLGFNTGEANDIKLDYPIEGLRHCSGKECIPLPIILGHLFSIIENKDPDEIVGYYMIRGGTPCAVYSYYKYIEQVIRDNKIKNVFIFRFDQFTNFLGEGFFTVAKYLPKAYLLADIMDEIKTALMVVGKNGSKKLLNDYWLDFLQELDSLKKIDKELEVLIDKIATIPRKSAPKNFSKVLVSGDFFVRFSPFFLKELKEIYAKHDIIVKSTDLYELILQAMMSVSQIMAHKWRKDPYTFSTDLYALGTFWKKESRLFLLSKLTPYILQNIEKRFKRRFEKTGLLFGERNNLHSIFRHSKKLINPIITCEAITTIGKGLEVLDNSIYDSLILTGPQYCLPYKVSQAILKPIYMENHTPFLVFDVDTSALTPNVRRLIHSNIEQIKRKRINN